MKGVCVLKSQLTTKDWKGCFQFAQAAIEALQSEKPSQLKIYGDFHERINNLRLDDYTDLKGKCEHAGRNPT